VKGKIGRKKVTPKQNIFYIKTKYVPFRVSNIIDIVVDCSSSCCKRFVQREW
jgi:hypothetical protein